MAAELIVLRLVHVLGGIFWVGSGLFTTFFLVPALAGSGPTMGAVMSALQRRRLFLVLPTVAVVTILSGTRLLWITSDGFGAAYFATRAGLAFAVSGALATAAFLLAMVIVRPAAVRMGAMGATMAQTTDDAERARLGARLEEMRRRNALLSTLTTILLLLGAAGMAVARYLG
jgi:uncharacterized membrane protein